MTYRLNTTTPLYFLCVCFFYDVDYIYFTGLGAYGGLLSLRGTAVSLLRICRLHRYSCYFPLYFPFP